MTTIPEYRYFRSLKYHLDAVKLFERQSEDLKELIKNHGGLVHIVKVRHAGKDKKERVVYCVYTRAPDLMYV
jgi:hypothetical protein